jgi:peptidase E
MRVVADTADHMDWMMTAERSDILRPGAIIQHVERVAGIWVKITTNYGTIYFAGGRTAEMLTCRRCQETRLVEVVETAKVQRGVCLVCSASWAIAPVTSSISAPSVVPLSSDEGLSDGPAPLPLGRDAISNE